MDDARGKITIFTGTGHGKTSAALGNGLQAASHGRNVVIITFLKGKGFEHSTFYKQLEPQIKLFCFEKSTKNWDEMTEDERQDACSNIHNGLHYAKKVLDTGECDLLIMDEILGVVDNKIITIDDLREVVERRESTDIIMTGITMDDRVCEFADEISEIHTVAFKKF